MKRMSLVWIPSLALLALGTAHAQPASNSAPAASAAQVGQCNKVAGKLLGNLQQGQFKQASGLFESNLDVKGSKLKKTWTQVTGKVGAMQSAGQAAHGAKIKGYTVVLVPVTFENGKLAAQVACDSHGEVGDLRFGH